MGRRTTISEVAQHAGVSVSSVSRVLNGHQASPRTVERVLASVDALGFVVDWTARSLKSGRTGLLAIAVPDIRNLAYIDTIGTADRVVSAAGYRLLLLSIGDDPGPDAAFVRELARGYVDGLVLCPLRITPELEDAVAAAARPVVVVSSAWEAPGTDNVRGLAAGGARLALEHLRDQGHRRVALLNGPEDTVPGTAHVRGFHQVARDLGLETDPSLVVSAERFSYEDGFKAAVDLLSRQHGAEAVVCASDQLGIAMINAAHDRGVDVPRELAVVAMDNTEIGTYPRPDLTSVDLRAAERGRVAAELVLARVDDPERPPQRVVVPPRLVVRGSSVPIG